MKFLIAVVLVLATCVAVESILDGTDAKATDFSHQVIVIVPTGNEKFRVGGGSVISNSWILTAAHSFDKGNKSQTEIWFGYNENQEFTFTARAINVIMHEKYINNKGMLSNNIALVQIPSVQYTIYIRPIALSHTSSIVNQTVTVAGFGSTSATHFSSILQVTTMMVRDGKLCNELFGKSFSNTDQFCTNDKGTSACAGDSGGPACIGSGLNLQQVGVVSNRLKEECVAGNPTSYTRVSSFVPWINKKTGLIF